jgi:hypothetical protein
LVLFYLLGQVFLIDFFFFQFYSSTLNWLGIELLSSSIRFYSLWFWNLGLGYSPKFAWYLMLLNWYLMLLNWLNLLNPNDLITWVLIFLCFFRNPSITLTLFFLHLEKFNLTRSIAPTTDISLLRSFFYFFIWFFSLSIFNIWFIIIGFFNLFWCGFHVFITISHPRSRVS